MTQATSLQKWQDILGREDDVLNLRFALVDGFSHGVDGGITFLIRDLLD